jgi:hypothetical protein
MGSTQRWGLVGTSEGFFKSNWLLKIAQFVSDKPALTQWFTLVTAAMGSLGTNKQGNSR